MLVAKFGLKYRAKIRRDIAHDTLQHALACAQEFIDLIGEAAESLTCEKVIGHLRATRFVVACQLPTTDIDDDGFEANYQFLNYFVQHHGGLIQADGEGFYEGSDLIVPVE